LQQKFYHQASEMIISSVSCYTAGPISQDAIEGVPDKLLKRAAMVFRGKK